MSTGILNRLESKIDKTSSLGGCWLWTRCLNGSGYGLINVGGRSKLAHRVSYELYKGIIPEEMCALHTCDTPACVNPDRLFLGTRVDNVADMCSKGRQNGGARVGNTTSFKPKTSLETLLKIRELLSGGFSQRNIAKLVRMSHSSVSKICNGGLKYCQEVFPCQV